MSRQELNGTPPEESEETEDASTDDSIFSAVSSATAFDLGFADVPLIEGLVYMPESDGHSFYHALAHYLNRTEKSLRQDVAQYIWNHLYYHKKILQRAARERMSVIDVVAAIATGPEPAQDTEVEVMIKVLERPLVIIASNGAGQVNPRAAEHFDGGPIFLYCNEDDPESVRYGAYRLAETSQDRGRALMARLTGAPQPRAAGAAFFAAPRSPHILSPLASLNEALQPTISTQHHFDFSNRVIDAEFLHIAAIPQGPYRRELKEHSNLYSFGMAVAFTGAVSGLYYNTPTLELVIYNIVLLILTTRNTYDEKNPNARPAAEGIASGIAIALGVLLASALLVASWWALNRYIRRDSVDPERYNSPEALLAFMHVGPTNRLEPRDSSQALSVSAERRIQEITAEFTQTQANQFFEAANVHIDHLKFCKPAKASDRHADLWPGAIKLIKECAQGEHDQRYDTMWRFIRLIYVYIILPKRARMGAIAMPNYETWLYDLAHKARLQFDQVSPERSPELKQRIRSFAHLWDETRLTEKDRREILKGFFSVSWIRTERGALKLIDTHDDLEDLKTAPENLRKTIQGRHDDIKMLQEMGTQKFVQIILNLVTGTIFEQELAFEILGYHSLSIKERAEIFAILLKRDVEEHILKPHFDKLMLTAALQPPVLRDSNSSVILIRILSLLEGEVEMQVYLLRLFLTNLVPAPNDREIAQAAIWHQQFELQRTALFDAISASTEEEILAGATNEQQLAENKRARNSSKLQAELRDLRQAAIHSPDSVIVQISAPAAASVAAHVRTPLLPRPMQRGAGTGGSWFRNPLGPALSVASSLYARRPERTNPLRPASGSELNTHNIDLPGSVPESRGAR